jgi:hypothetical protein
VYAVPGKDPKKPDYSPKTPFVATCNEAFGESAIGHRVLDGRSSIRQCANLEA